MPVQDLTVKGNKAFYLTDSKNAEDKYTVNDETIFVIVTAEYDANGEYTGEVTIKDGDLSDAKLSTKQDKDGWVLKGQVVKADERKAELVYIYRYDEDPTVITTTTVGGVRESAAITAFEPESLTGKISVTDRYNTGYTAIQLATLTLNDAGYVVDYVIGGDTIVATATRSDRQVTFTMEVDTAYAVTLDGGNYAPNLDVVYLTAGDSVEIEVYADNANWVGHTVNPSAGSFAKEKESEDTKTLYGTYTAAGDLAANTKVTLTVQKLAK